MASSSEHAAQPRPDWVELAIALVSGLALAFTALFLCAMPLAGHMAGSRDFVAYWATGHRLVAHANPYDRGAMTRIEQAAGLAPGGVLLMRNPPWALPLAWPLGLLGLRAAAALWTLLLLACLLVSVFTVRRLHGSPPNRLHWLGLAFTPALICLVMGQTSLFALLGVALFLRWRQARPFAAGLALWLCALKPHLLLPFAAVLAVWIVLRRGYRILAGAAVAMAASCVAATLIDPAAWHDYLAMMRAPAVEQEFIPCLSDALRMGLRPQALWLQYLPAALACGWALLYFWRRRHAWNWSTHSSPLLLVSLVAAPYCFLYDQGLAIPALLHGMYATRSRALLLALAGILLLLDAELCFVRIISGLYMWTAPIWLAWYLLARAGTHAPASETA